VLEVGYLGHRIRLALAAVAVVLVVALLVLVVVYLDQLFQLVAEVVQSVGAVLRHVHLSLSPLLGL